MLVIITDINAQETEYDIDNFVVTIGRSSECDITLANEHISRTHLEIKIDEGKILIRDVSGQNWVSYDGKPLSKDEFVQYFNFMELLLPGDFAVDIKNNKAVEVEATLTSIKPIGLTSTNTGIKTGTGTKKRGMKTRSRISRPNDSKSKEPTKIEKKKSMLGKNLDPNEKKKIIITVLLLIIVAFLALELKLI